MGPVIMIERNEVQSFWEINSADEPDLRKWCEARGRSLDPESLKPTQAAPGLDYPKDAEASKKDPNVETPTEASTKVSEEDQGTNKQQTSDTDPFSMDNK